MEILKVWNAECGESHPECTLRLNTGDDVNQRCLPTRLIDVGLLDEDTQPRLIRSSELDSSNARYITLSHSWGPKPELTNPTLAGNFGDRLQKLPEMPLTFQQAIKLVRRIGHRYLWTDSICIVQDDPDDMKAEFSTMSSVYGNAALNILASSSANSTQGCYNPGGLSTLHPCVLKWESQGVMIQPVMPSWDEVTSGSEGGPLSQRGWVVQERHLARRAVHFTPRRLVWECLSMRAYKDYPNPSYPYPSNLQANPQSRFGAFQMWHPFPMTGGLGDYLGVQTTIVNPENVYHSWLKLVAEYTSKKLTKESDKLWAIAGLARATNDITQDKYLAGIWRKDLLRQLCWHSNERRTFNSKPSIYRAPSWSWAAIDGTVRYPTFDYSPKDYGNSMAPEVVEAAVELQSNDVFGPVNGGFLKLRGCMAQVIPAVPEIEVNAAVWVRETTQRLRIYAGSENGTYMGLLVNDLPWWPIENPETPFFILKLWQFDLHPVEVLEDDDQGWECRLVGLGLELVDKVRNEFKRLGLVHIHPVAESLFVNARDVVNITVV